MSSEELIEHQRRIREDRRKVTPRTKKKLASVAGTKPKKPKDELAAMRKLLAKLTPEQRTALLGDEK